MKQKFRLILISLLLITFISCNDHNKKDHSKTHKSEVANTEHHNSKKDCNVVHWSHHAGEEGPNKWKDLCDGFGDCGGIVQSPIDIITKNVDIDNTLSAPIFSYGKSNVDIINNGHTVQFNVSGNNTVTLKNKDYKLGLIDKI